jgi:succinyl-diaminopimelate desuccinylase
MSLIGILTQLVSFETTAAHPDEIACALEWIEREMKKCPLTVHKSESNGVPSLVFTTQPTRKPKLLLVAHIDVVPAPAAAFTLLQGGDRLYGRGVLDMKFAAACYIQLCHELGASLAEYDFGIMLTTDEEHGGFDGTKALLDDEHFRCDFALIPDGGFNWQFEEQAKGILHIRVCSRGVSAHSSRPWEGTNPAWSLFAFLAAMNSYFEEQKRSSEYYSTMNISMISGGDAMNKVPDMLEARVDIRFVPEISKDKLAEKLGSIAREYKNIELEEISSGHPHTSDISRKEPKSFSRIARELYGITTGTSKAHGGSDARFFAEHNIPTFLIAPRGGGHHTDAEWIDAQDMERFYRVLKAWVMKWTKV